MKLNIDFETRSIVDLRQTGVYPYAQHADTDVWCMAFAFGDEDVQLMSFVDAADRPDYWETHPGLERIRAHVLSAGEVWAWNAQFERVIWNLILVPRYGFPKLSREQVYDTAAEAAALALPRGLGAAAKVLGQGEEKDDAGWRLMMKMAKPRATKIYTLTFECEHPDIVGATKTEVSRKTCPECRAPRVRPPVKRPQLVWHTDPEDRDRLHAYCRQDVRVERSVGKLLRPLSAFEREVYLLDQKANDRGVLIDRTLVESAIEMVEVATQEADETIRAVTAGAVGGSTKVADMTAWVRDQGVDLPNLKKDTVRDALETRLPDPVRVVLQLRQDTGKTSTAKLRKMLLCACSDDRARGLLLYHGASTGRWAGKLLQPQNFPRPELDAEAYIDRVLTLDYGGIDAPILKVISSMLRSMLRAGAGRRFMAGDYSQVEARVLAWLAGQTDLIELFRSGGKIYETMAAFIFKMEVEDIAKNSFERQIGKNSVLGAGFQMGPDRFAEQVWAQTGIVLDRGEKADKNYCHACDVFQKNQTDLVCYLCGGPTQLEEVVIRPDLAAQAIHGYRTLYDRIPQFWKDIEQAAIRAVQRPGTVHSCAGGRIRYTMRGRVLWCVLPSGRMLAYFSPELRMRSLPEPYEDVQKLSLSYTGIDKTWRRRHTYGGHLTENVVQAIARDLMADAMLRLEDAGYPVVLTVHDEVLTETPVGHGSVAAFEKVMTTLPTWADGLPVAAEGWEGERYRK